MKRTCEYLLVHCIDYRLQSKLNSWAEDNLGAGNYDRLSIAGGVLDAEMVLSHVRIALRLHRITTVILINHEDCGAYGEEGTLERHRTDLENIKALIQKEFPEMDVRKLYLLLNGQFEIM